MSADTIDSKGASCWCAYTAEHKCCWACTDVSCSIYYRWRLCRTLFTWLKLRNARCDQKKNWVERAFLIFSPEGTFLNIWNFLKYTSGKVRTEHVRVVPLPTTHNPTPKWLHPRIVPHILSCVSQASQITDWWDLSILRCDGWFKPRHRFVERRLQVDSRVRWATCQLNSKRQQCWSPSFLSQFSSLGKNVVMVPYPNW